MGIIAALVIVVTFGVFAIAYTNHLDNEKMGVTNN